MPVIHLAHGFRVRDRGANTVHRIEPLLVAEGLEVRRFSYPFTHLLFSWHWNTRWAVEELCERVQPGDGLIGHSHGCAIAARAAEAGAPFRWMILVQPALNANREFAAGLEQVHVYFNRGDAAVLAGKWWRRKTRLMPWRWRNPHDWGAMGRYGYLGGDRRIFNHQTPRSLGHSGVWRDEFWLAHIARRARLCTNGILPSGSQAPR